MFLQDRFIILFSQAIVTSVRQMRYCAGPDHQSGACPLRFSAMATTTAVTAQMNHSADVSASLV